MLTDIFAERYLSRVLWEAYTETESKLLVQCFRIVAEQLIPYWVDGKESVTAKAKWTSLHDRLSMELGLDELAPRYYSYQTTWMGKPYTQSGFWTYDKVCKDFVCAKYTGAVSPDRFMKERISFVELAFRLCEEELTALNLELPKKIEAAKLQVQARGLRIPGSTADGIKAFNDSLNASFKAAVDELNERFRRTATQLNYHNGFIQVATDPLVEEQIERAFWEVVADPMWKNVDIDMKEALDRRDANDRDPAFYAARALESAIKIISDRKSWTHGGEKGAHNYIENLSSKNSGGFIKDWERDALKSFFTSIRNPFGHGPGSAEMPQLTLEQTNWAIETCMSWIKGLVQRM
ncbi:MAG: hypothetical protein ABSG71_00910 [Thermodesulfobacteriota bacterium]|jgi:hypothetical protein